MLGYCGMELGALTKSEDTTTYHAGNSKYEWRIGMPITRSDEDIVT